MYESFGGGWFYLESHRSVLGSYLYVGIKLISPSMKSVKALFVCRWMFNCAMKSIDMIDTSNRNTGFQFTELFNQHFLNCDWLYGTEANRRVVTISKLKDKNQTRWHVVQAAGVRWETLTWSNSWSFFNSDLAMCCLTSAASYIKRR